MTSYVIEIPQKYENKSCKLKAGVPCFSGYSNF